jgi:ABC-type multidrug transport system permease subunit
MPPVTDPVPTAATAGRLDGAGPDEAAGAGSGDAGSAEDALQPAEVVEQGSATSTVQRALIGALYGVVAAVVVGFGWFLASVGTKSQLVYLAVPIGVAVGYFVNVGARRGSALTSVVAVLVTLVGCTSGFYFVSRSSLIRRGYVNLVGHDPRIPLRPSFRLVRDVLRVNLRSNIAPYLYVALALVAAAYFGLRGLDATKRRADH